MSQFRPLLRCCTVKATAPTVVLTEPDVPVTVIVYGPGIVPVLPPRLPPPPQAMSSVETNRSGSPIIPTQSFRLRGLTKSNTNAKVAPLDNAQKKFLFGFSALDAAVVLPVSVESVRKHR